MPGEDDDLCLGAFDKVVVKIIDGAGIGKSEAEDGDVGIEIAEHRKTVSSIVGLADQFNIALVVNNRLYAETSERLVLDEKKFDRHKSEPPAVAGGLTLGNSR